MGMSPGGDVIVGVDAADRFDLGQGGMREPMASVKDADPAPTPEPEKPLVEAPAAPPAEPASDSIEALNKNLMALVEKLEPRNAGDAAATAKAAAAPDPVDALLEHPDPEIRQLAEITKQQREQLNRIESRHLRAEQQQREEQASAFERELLAQQKAAATKYGLSDAECEAVMVRWEKEVERDPRLAILTFEEALSRIADPAALEARRAGLRKPAPGEKVLSRAPEPPAPQRAPAFVAASAAGGGREARQPLSGNMSNDQVSQLVLKERFGQG